MNQCVVATAGCFDVLHAGHVDLLRQCKGLGDHLVVFLNSDDSIKRLKGEHRPVNPFVYRKAMLEEFRSVDHVAIFHQDDPCQVLEILKPNIYVKGAEYKDQNIPEESLVRSWGGLVVYLDKTIETLSSSNVLMALGFTG